MAILGKKTKKAEKKDLAVTEKAPATGTHFHSVLMKPRITEKASVKVESNVYTFEVSKEATKNKVAGAVKEIYKVSPVKVAIVNIPSKKVFVRGKSGVKKGGRKAYVYLKEGDKIEFV